MLHETILDQSRPLPANIAAVWPVSPTMAPLPVTEMSERSIANRSNSVDFPDFTRGEWRNRPPLGIIDPGTMG